MRDGPLPLAVVKLGGSLVNSPHLRAWLAAIATPAAVGRLIVPGGGVFADTVRKAQTRFGFSDRAAHRMAILAMQQYGLLLADLGPGLDPVETPDAMRRLADSAGAGVWLPWRLAADEPALGSSWDVTSDSIALWLAGRLRARRMVLVKRGHPPDDPAEAVRSGVVDPAFPRFLEGLGCPVHILAEEDHTRFAATIAGGGTR